MTAFNSTLHVVLWLKGALPSLSNEVNQVPSFKKLAEMKSCGISTIRKAMKQLESEGIVISKHGYGTFLLDQNRQKITAPNKIQLNEDANKVNSDPTINQKKPLIALFIPIALTKNNIHRSIIQYLSFIAAGATQSANENQCDLTIHFFEREPLGTEKSVNKFIRYIKENNCSAVLLASITDTYVINKIAATGIPGIMIDHWAPFTTNWLSIIPNHFQALRDMVLVLAQLQHKRILLIDREDPSLNPEIQKGYQSGLKKAEIEYDEKLVCHMGQKQIQFKKTVTKILRLLKTKNRPTAIITQAHIYVPGLIQSLATKGYKVPDDISIISLGPKMDVVKHLNVAGYKVDWPEMGREAIARALDLINKKDVKSNTIYFDLDYVPGKSVSYCNSQIK